MTHKGVVSCCKRHINHINKKPRNTEQGCGADDGTGAKLVAVLNGLVVELVVIVALEIVTERHRKETDVISIGNEAFDECRLSLPSTQTLFLSRI